MSHDEIATRPFARFLDGMPVGDVIPFASGGNFHLFILTPPPQTLHFPQRLRTTWRHVVSKNLVDWTELSFALEPGSVGEPDSGGVWTGSVVAAKGKFHIFYTGHGPDERFVQSICHATSDDLIHWKKDPANPISTPDPRRFESSDWRDPYVFRNESDELWWMLITARSATDDAASRGVVAVATSTDLVSWSEPRVLHRTFMTHAPECPEIFRLRDQWVLGFSRFTDRRGTVYRVADNLDGPWRARGEDGPDSAHWYAAKGLTTGDGRRIAFGWIPDHDANPLIAANPWLWAGDLALPRELQMNERGELSMMMPRELDVLLGAEVDSSLAAVYGNWSGDSHSFRAAAAGSSATRIYSHSSDTANTVFTADFSGVADTHQLGVVVHTSAMLDEGIGVFYYPGIGCVRLVNMKAPVGKVTAEYETMFGQYSPIAEHELPETLGDRVRFRIVMRGDLVEAFVGEHCCLTVRADSRSSTHTALVIVDGNCSIDSTSWRKLG